MLPEWPQAQLQRDSGKATSTWMNEPLPLWLLESEMSQRRETSLLVTELIQAGQKTPCPKPPSVWFIWEILACKGLIKSLLPKWQHPFTLFCPLKGFPPLIPPSFPDSLKGSWGRGCQSCSGSWYFLSQRKNQGSPKPLFFWRQGLQQDLDF